MDKIFKAIVKFIKNIVKKIVKFIKKFWWVIAIVLAIWFAPAIAAWLLSSGAPAWLSTAFSWVATTVTPGLTSLAGWMSSGLGKLFVGPESAWASLSLGTKASLILGASAMIMPDETAELVSGVAEGVVDVATDVGGAVIGGIFGGSLGVPLLIGGGLLLFFMFRRNKNA